MTKLKVAITLSLILLVILAFSPLLFFKIKLIGDNNIVVNYGDEYSEPGYKAYSFNNDITPMIIVNNKIDNELGGYEIIYTCKTWFYDIKTKRNIIVKDIEKPAITLIGDKEMSITIGSEYIEPGYKAIDNYDGDLTDKVVVSNNIDITTIGEYDITYEVSDSHGNKEKVIRKLKIEKRNPTQMNLQEYTLEGWYDNTHLKENIKDESYFSKIVMIGDSNIKNMYLSGVLKNKQAWALPCLHAESMFHNDIVLYGYNKEAKLLDAISLYKPEIIILNLGTFSTAWINYDTFYECANKLIEEIKKLSPNTQIILSSIYPITKGYNINNFDQNIINKYNFYILQIADKNNIKYLDIQEVLKDEEGYGKQEYYRSDNYHLNETGQKLVKEYIINHAL